LVVCRFFCTFVGVMDEKQLQDKLHFAGEKVPSMKRRSETHDYHGQRFYPLRNASIGLFRCFF